MNVVKDTVSDTLDTGVNFSHACTPTQAEHSCSLQWWCSCGSEVVHSSPRGPSWQRLGGGVAAVWYLTAFTVVVHPVILYWSLRTSLLGIETLPHGSALKIKSDPWCCGAHFCCKIFSGVKIFARSLHLCIFSLCESFTMCCQRWTGFTFDQAERPNVDVHLTILLSVLAILPVCHCFWPQITVPENAVVMAPEWKVSFLCLEAHHAHLYHHILYTLHHCCCSYFSKKCMRSSTNGIQRRTSVFFNLDPISPCVFVCDW